MHDKQNKTKQNQLKENTSKLVGCSDQFSHNTCGSGDGATSNKLPRRRKKNCLNVLNLASTHFFCLAKALLIIEMARVTIKQMEDENENIKSQWKFKS
jgi:hypothetical protein